MPKADEKPPITHVLMIVGTRSTYSGLAAASGGYSRGASVGATFAVLADTEGVVDPNA